MTKRPRKSRCYFCNQRHRKAGEVKLTWTPPGDPAYDGPAHYCDRCTTMAIAALPAGWQLAVQRIR